MAREDWPRRFEILRYLARCISRGEGSPSVREVGAAVGLRSSQPAYKHLGKLEEAGYIEVAEARARGISLTAKGWEFVGGAPMLGRIAAGRGLEAVLTEDDGYSLPGELLYSRTGGRRFTLRVVGQSMTGAGIEDGDVLVVEESENPPDGSVVVALLNGGEEVTVKRLYREGDVVRLVPENGAHEEIVVSPLEVGIQGEVVFVVHPPRR